MDSQLHNSTDKIEEIAVVDRLFSVDYCKRGTTKCKVCKKQIPKHDLRIGKSVQFKRKTIVQFHHITCAFKSFEKARPVRNVITTIDDVGEINDITH